MITIIEYLKNPPENWKRFVINWTDYWAKVDFEENTLSDMINRLPKSKLDKLINEVETVCIQWSTMKVAPNNDIGTIARFQLCKKLLNKL